MPDLRNRDRVNLPRGRGVVVAVSSLFAVVAFDDGTVDEIDRFLGPAMIESPSFPHTADSVENRLEATRTRLAITRGRADILRSGRPIEGLEETETEEGRAAALEEFEAEIPEYRKTIEALERDLAELYRENERVEAVRRRLRFDGMILG